MSVNLTIRGGVWPGNGGDCSLCAASNPTNLRVFPEPSKDQFVCAGKGIGT
jgi:hypothetical protein